MTVNVALALAFLVVSAPLLDAHHSVSVNFDQSREVTIVGVLTEVEWRNPHAHFRVDVVEGGDTVEYLVEMGAVNTMKRAGFPLERFVVGSRLTLIGHPSRGRDRAMILRETVLADGTRLTPEMRERTPAP